MHMTELKIAPILLREAFIRYLEEQGKRFVESETTLRDH